jgi:hypothetical protein
VKAKQLRIGTHKCGWHTSAPRGGTGGNAMGMQVSRPSAEREQVRVSLCHREDTRTALPVRATALQGVV